MEKNDCKLMDTSLEEHVDNTVEAILAGEQIYPKDFTDDRRRKLIERLREVDRPLLATESAHGPG